MDDGSARIELRRRKGPSMWAVIDAADRERVALRSWHAIVSTSTIYVMTTIRLGDRFATLSLHRFLLDAPPGVKVDHRDGNGLNNRRSNLRLADESQNRANAGKALRPKSSRYKGVSRAKAGKWQVSIANNYLGCYSSEEEAARVYDAAARERYGEWACVNFPLDSSRSAA